MTWDFWRRPLDPTPPPPSVEPPPSHPFLLRTVIVNLKDPSDEALRGALWEYRDPWLVLRKAEALHAGAAPTPIDGEAVIHRDNCAFLQVLP